jgi:hypothetical protein
MPAPRGNLLDGLPLKVVSHVARCNELAVIQPPRSPKVRNINMAMGSNVDEYGRIRWDISAALSQKILPVYEYMLSIRAYICPHHNKGSSFRVNRAVNGDPIRIGVQPSYLYF